MNQSTNQHINRSVNIWIKVSLLVGAFMFAYWGAVTSLVRMWLSYDEYSHGFLIPLISLYFVWSDRKRLRHLPIQSSILGGLILTLTGSLLLVMGSASSVVMMQQISIIVTIPGLVLILLGTKYLKALSLPLAYLIFMFPPILDLVISKTHWPFQLFSAKVASILLNILNIPVLRNAQYLELPNTTLEVAEACSGVRYLVSIIAMGIPLACHTQKNWLRKVMLVIFAVIIGILTNPIRIALIGLWSYNGGEDLHGPFHIFKGVFVSVVGFIFFFIGAWVLAKIPLLNIKKSLKKEESKGSDLTTNMKKFNLVWLTSIVIFLGVGSYLYLYNPKPIPLNASLTEIPSTIGNWKGKDIDYHNKEPFGIQGADFELMRVYRNAFGHEVKLYVGYFESQRQDKELINYRQRMLYNDTEELEIPTISHDSIQVNKTVLEDGTQNSIVLYWYDLNGRIVADRYKAKFITAIDGLIHRQTNGAIIIVSSNLIHPDEMQKVLNDEVDFIQEFFPFLDNFFPMNEVQ
jgi:EpsI family protein